MMDKLAVFFISLLFALILIPTKVFANSSWHWLTKSPWELLPIVVIVTLLIETAAVVLIGKIKERKRAFIVVCIANIASFLLPYVFRMLNFWSVMGAPFKAVDGPYYIICTAYLLLTILIELPIVYFFLVEKTQNKRWMLISILLSNVITTALTAAVERIFCRGSW